MKMQKFKIVWAILLLATLTGACKKQYNDVCKPDTNKYTPTAAEVEKDNIFSLLAYAVVLKDWQDDSKNGRGYNIGGVLVDSNDHLVCWARNSVNVTNNGTQHGEVRMITNYLQNAPVKKLKEYKLYTTLEPCAMCSGMMTLTNLFTTIYGQKDPDFGDAIQRLRFNSKAEGGYCPYPRGVNSVAAENDVRKKIDTAYQKYQEAGGTSITEWLSTAEAKIFYEEAAKQLKNFTVKFPENQSSLTAAQNFLSGVPSKYTKTPYAVNCSGK